MENNITERLKNLFRMKFRIDFDALNSEYLNKDLLDERFRFSARDLLCLYFWVKEEFSINIPEKDIADGKFISFNNIKKIIQEECHK